MVFEEHPGIEPMHGHLAAAVQGHAEILAAISEHAQHDQLQRKIARQGYDGAALDGSDMGESTGSAPGPGPGR